MHCAEFTSRAGVVWLGRGKDNESEKGRGLFPGCSDRRRFSEAVCLEEVKVRERERGPGVHALRSGGTTIKKSGFGFGEQKVRFAM